MGHFITIHPEFKNFETIRFKILLIIKYVILYKILRKLTLVL